MIIKHCFSIFLDDDRELKKFIKNNFVVGKFGITKTKIDKIICDVYQKDNVAIVKKTFFGNLPKSINKWIVKYQSNSDDYIGLLSNYPPDFQNKNKVFIQINRTERSGAIKITQSNLKQVAVYFAVRHCIEANWLNDRDQFLFPNKKWEKDKEFQNDCLAFTLFHGQNRISCKHGTNHWIPFTEQEVNAKEKFDSNFMSNYIKGKQNPPQKPSYTIYAVFEPEQQYCVPLKFSDQAKALFDAGRELWKYYHSKLNVDVNASLYDIREYFQGRNENGKMNNKSSDEKYNELIGNLREKLSILATKIEPKIFEYEFLLK